MSKRKVTRVQLDELDAATTVVWGENGPEIYVSLADAEIDSVDVDEVTDRPIIPPYVEITRVQRASKKRSDES